MSEAIRSMTEYEAECERVIAEKDKQISEMQSYIDCLRAELAEVQMNKSEFPLQPIKAADMLIENFSSGSVDYIHSAMENGYSYNDRTFDEMYKQEVKQLHQIAEHLLVYCNNAEV